MALHADALPLSYGGFISAGGENFVMDTLGFLSLRALGFGLRRPMLCAFGCTSESLS